MGKSLSRNSRYSQLLSKLVLGTTSIVVIGVGAIGKNLVEMLVSIGFTNIAILDGDRVGIENLGTQGFITRDIGRYKVDCVRERCLELNPNCEIKTFNEFFKQDSSLYAYTPDIVISCVDSMETRFDIFRHASEYGIGDDSSECDILCIDSRMGLQNMSIISFMSTGFDVYKQFWYSDENSIQESCTTKSTLYCASAAASIICSNIVKYVNGEIVPYHINLNLIDYNTDVIAYSDADHLSRFIDKLSSFPDFRPASLDYDKLRKIAQIIYTKEIKF